MKREKLRTMLVSAAVSLLVALGGAGCFVSGFGLRLEHGLWVTASIILASVLCTTCFLRRRGGLIVLCAAAVIGGYLWHEGTAWEQIRYLLYRVSHVYDSAYGWGVLRLTEGSWSSRFSDLPADLPVSILGCAAAMGTCWAMCRRKSSAWGLVPGLLMLGLCMVVTDTVPGITDLFLLLGGCVLLLITGSVRKESTAQGSRVALRAAVPAAVFLVLVTLAIPKEGYVNHSREIQEALARLVMDFPGQLRRTVGGLTDREFSEKVDLSALGPQGRQSLPILEINGSRGGTVYLRGQDYDRYTGTGWESTPDREESFSGSGRITGEVSVRTLTGSYGILYLPYYPSMITTLSGGKCENIQRERVYTFSIQEEPSRSEAGDHANYLSLPSETSARAWTLSREIVSEDASDREKAAAIADYVGNSARYDRDTGRMPRGETDFALWFLEESETGYCVHFATAAAVLLRAAGVPARYVTGYLAQCRGTEWNVVRLDQAHAWVEYFDSQSDCWTLLDATPADLTQEETEPVEETTQPSRETEDTRQETQETVGDTPLPTEQTVLQTTPETRQDPDWLLPLGRWLLTAALAAAVLMLQRTVRIYRRQRRENTGITNRRALALWQEAERLSSLLRQTPPEELRQAAQKAKFSQYTLEPEELEPFTAYLRRCRDRLKKAPWYYQVYYRWILAVY